MAWLLSRRLITVRIKIRSQCAQEQQQILHGTRCPDCIMRSQCRYWSSSSNTNDSNSDSYSKLVLRTVSTSSFTHRCMDRRCDVSYHSLSGDLAQVFEWPVDNRYVQGSNPGKVVGWPRWLSDRLRTDRSKVRPRVI